MDNINNYEALREAAYHFLFDAENHVVTVYIDSVGIPTIGVGIALVIFDKSKGEYKLRGDLDKLEANYMPGINWPALKVDLEIAVMRLNGTTEQANPFYTEEELNNGKMAETIAKYGSIDKTTFKNVTWDQYIYNNYYKELHNKLGYNNLNALSLREQTALYSLCYNNPSLIGGGLASAVNLYVNGSTAVARFIGKLEAWRQILYVSNSANGKGIQNRRFYEANEFLGLENNTKPNGATDAQSVVPVANLEEALLFFSFMNTPITQSYKVNDSTVTYTQPVYWHMYRKFYDINDYQHNDYRFAKAHSQEAYEVLFDEKNIVDMRSADNIPINKYAPEYELENLYQSWNIKTDAKLLLDGSGQIVQNLENLFSNQNDMFISVFDSVVGSAEVFDAGLGDDYLDTSSYNADNVIYVNLNSGYDTYVGGAATDYVNAGVGVDNAFTYNHADLGGGNNLYIGTAGTDTVSTAGESWNINTVYLGNGNDTYYGSNGDDIVDGGSGALPNLDEVTKDALGIINMPLADLTDTVWNTNKVFLGGGSDVYTGSDGNDIVFGSASDAGMVIYDDDGKATDWINRDTDSVVNTISLGAGNDQYYSSGGTNIVSAEYSNNGDEKYICFKNGNNTYTCSNGHDTVKCEGGINHINNAFMDDIYFKGGTNFFDGSGNVYLDGGTNTLNFSDLGGNIYGVSQDDIITFDVNSSYFVCNRVGNDVEVVSSNGNHLTFKNVLNDGGQQVVDLPKINGITLPAINSVGGYTVIQEADLLIQSMNSFGVSNSVTTDFVPLDASAVQCDISYGLESHKQAM